MTVDETKVSSRMLVLIAQHKLADKAEKLFHAGSVPFCWQLGARGTASDEIMDIFGMGDIDKTMMIAALPKTFADKMLDKLNHELRLSRANTGIAFTLPISGVNHLIFQMLKDLSKQDIVAEERKDGANMAEMKYAMIAVFANRGYSEDIVGAAASAGAAGGTVLNSRSLSDQKVLDFWGFQAQEEKEITMILAQADKKLSIMQAIGKTCGLHSEAKGVVLSLPVDQIVGLES